LPCLTPAPRPLQDEEYDRDDELDAADEDEDMGEGQAVGQALPQVRISAGAGTRGAAMCPAALHVARAAGTCHCCCARARPCQQAQRAALTPCSASPLARQAAGSDLLVVINIPSHKDPWES
jgi:hypothetical protein